MQEKGLFSSGNFIAWGAWDVISYGSEVDLLTPMGLNYQVGRPGYSEQQGWLPAYKTPRVTVKS